MHQSTGLKILQRMPITIPTLRHIEPRTLRDIVASYISRLSIPGCLREYFGRTLTVVAKRHTSVRDVLCTRKIPLNFSEIQEHATLPCKCADLAAAHGLPLVDGHLMVRRPAHLRKLFGNKTPIVIQDLKAEPVLPSWTAKTMVTSGLKRLLSHLPVNPTSAPDLYTEVVSHVRTAWCAERTIQPWYCRHDAIERVKEDHPEFIFLPMDKNESRCFACCPTLYYTKSPEIYSDPAQFEFICDCESPKDAREYVSSPCVRAMLHFFHGARKFSKI